MKNLEEFIKTKYIQGKSYKFLLEYLTEDGHDLESCENIISAIHYKYWQKRKRGSSFIGWFIRACDRKA